MVPNGAQQLHTEAGAEEQSWRQEAQHWDMSTTWDMQLDSTGEQGQATAVSGQM